MVHNVSRFGILASLLASLVALRCAPCLALAPVEGADEEAKLQKRMWDWIRSYGIDPSSVAIKHDDEHGRWMVATRVSAAP
jgi:hypothetical protein